MPHELEGTTTWDKLHTREARFRRFLLRKDGIAFEFEYDRSNILVHFQSSRTAHLPEA